MSRPPKEPQLKPIRLHLSFTPQVHDMANELMRRRGDVNISGLLSELIRVAYVRSRMRAEGVSVESFTIVP